MESSVFTILQDWMNYALTWVGFGLVVGLLARALAPGRDPGGAVATLTTGIGGALLGCGVLAIVTRGNRIQPVSAVGLLVATAGALVILMIYRILAGHWLHEGSPRRAVRRPRRSRPEALVVD